MTRSVSNPTRGCGQLVEGGFYASSDLSSSGILRNWTWLLGQHVDGGRNLLWNIPPRTMQLIALPYSIVRGTPILAEHAIDTDPTHRDSKAWNLPSLALVDHVGANNYTPWSFAREVIGLGPSRRVPESVARQIVQITPIPIVFTHEWLPMADPNSFVELYNWAIEDQPFNTQDYFSPTWDKEGFGFTIRDPYDGHDHWTLPVMAAMHESADGSVTPIHKIMPHPLAEDVLTTEQAFGVSWITSVRYIMRRDGEDDEVIDSLEGSGIEPVQIEEDTTG